MVTTHPTDVELQDFLVGNLPEGKFAAIESHLSNCDDCLDRAAGGQASDTLVRLLVAAGTQLVAQRSVAATPAPLDTQPGLRGTLAGNPEALSNPAFAAPPAIANHPRYKLLRWLGAGGMGSVWQAEHLVLERLVAIKVIRPEFLAKVGAAERFRREARAVAKLSHPNIVAAFDAEEVAGTHFLVMEYVAGENLGDVLGRGALPVAEACQIVRDAARGLAHAHSHNLVHRDIKPHNLIRAADGTTKILDFGLATAEAGSREGLTGEDMVLGTPDYIAPEQAQDARSADASSDVYSLGCTLFALIAGQAPFAGGTALSKIDSHRHSPIPPLPQAPAELAALVARMLAKKPSERPMASAVSEALDPFCAGAKRPPTIITTQPAPRRLSPGILALCMVLLLGGLTAAGVIYKIQTDRQEIEIETNDPNIQVVLRRNGQLVRIKDTKTKQSWNLDAEKLHLQPDGSELSIDLPDKEPLVIRRAGEKSITIRWKPLAVNSTPPAPTVALAAGETIKPYRTLEGHSQRSRVAIFSADGKTVYSGSDDGFVRVWDVEACRETAKFDVGDWVFGLALFDGGKSLIVTTQPQLRVWDLVAGKETAPFPPNAGGGFMQPAVVSPDGRKAAAGSDAGTVRVWDIAERKLEHEWPAAPALPAYSVAWSPDGHQVAAGMHETLTLFDYPSGKRAHRIYKFRRLVRLGFTADGENIVAHTMDPAVEVYDRKTGRMHQAFDPGRIHGQAAVFGATVGNEHVVTSGRGHLLDLWHWPTGTKLATFAGHTGETHGVSVSADGKHVVSVGEDTTVRIWKLPEGLK